MMERMSSSKDQYVESVGKKIKQEQRRIEKAALVDRIRERTADIVLAMERNQDEFARAADFAEKMAVTTQYFQLESDLETLKKVYQKVLKPSREEFEDGREPLSKADLRLLEEEAPFLLVGGKKPVRDTKEAGIEMELEERDLEPHDDETVVTSPETDVRRFEALAPVPFETDEPSLTNYEYAPSGAEEKTEVRAKERTTSRVRLTPEKSEENILIESIDRKAASLSEAERHEYYRKKRDAVLDELSRALTRSSEMPDAEQELLVARLEARFHVLQGRVNQWKEKDLPKTKQTDTRGMRKAA
jgi:hypothetical protein